MSHRYRTLLVAASSAVLIVLGGCASLPSTAEQYIAPAPGATWVHVRSDSGSYGSASQEIATRRVSGAWEGRDAIGLRSAEGTLLLRPTGEWVAQLNREGAAVVTWDPPLVWDWPIRVGKSWTRSYTMTLHPAGRKISYDVRQTVEALENITVPAGTFRTFRIASTDTLGNEDRFWFEPHLGIFIKLSLKRTDKHPQGPGRREVELLSHATLPR